MDKHIEQWSLLLTKTTSLPFQMNFKNAQRWLEAGINNKRNGNSSVFPFVIRGGRFLSLHLHDQFPSDHETDVWCQSDNDSSYKQIINMQIIIILRISHNFFTLSVKSMWG